jgi:hypothetical protein
MTRKVSILFAALAVTMLASFAASARGGGHAFGGAGGGPVIGPNMPKPPAQGTPRPPPPGQSR